MRIELAKYGQDAVLDLATFEKRGGSSTKRPVKKTKGYPSVRTESKYHCPQTAKRRYRGIEEAKAALRSTKSAGQFETGRYGSSKRNEKRYYPCPLCNGWHLSSQAVWGVIDGEQVAA